jgi:hypothetical protein
MRKECEVIFENSKYFDKKDDNEIIWKDNE